MVQLGGFNALDFMFNSAGTIFNRMCNLGRKVADDKIILAADLFKTFKKVPFNKLSGGSGINLTNNEIKDIIKVVRLGPWKIEEFY